MDTGKLKETAIVCLSLILGNILVDCAWAESLAMSTLSLPFLLKRLLLSILTGYLIHCIYLKSGLSEAIYKIINQ
jgi:hypothetical protein